jgi:hypothetical protein
MFPIRIIIGSVRLKRQHLNKRMLFDLAIKSANEISHLALLLVSVKNGYLDFLY